MLKYSSSVIGEGKRAGPFGPRSKNEDIVLDAFVRGKKDRPGIVLFILFDRSDAANLDGTIIVDKKVIIRDENGILKLALSGGGHADGGRKVKGKGTGSYEGEGCCVGVDFGGEDASNGSASCPTTDDDNTLAVSVGHCKRGKRIEGRMKVVKG